MAVVIEMPLAVMSQYQIVKVGAIQVVKVAESQTVMTKKALVSATVLVEGTEKTWSAEIYLALIGAHGLSLYRGWTFSPFTTPPDLLIGSVD